MTRTETTHRLNHIGLPVTVVGTPERCVVAGVVKRHGAYLIDWQGPATDDLTPDALYDVAGSLTVAKRVAREGAIEMGYRPAWRWQQTSFGWVLEGTYMDEIEHYEDDEDVQ